MKKISFSITRTMSMCSATSVYLHFLGAALGSCLVEAGSTIFYLYSSIALDPSVEAGVQGSTTFHLTLLTLILLSSISIWLELFLPPFYISLEV